MADAALTETPPSILTPPAAAEPSPAAAEGVPPKSPDAVVPPEGAKPTEAKAPEVKPPEAKAEEPIKYEYKLPEGVTLQPEGLAEVNKLFAEAKVPQAQAQSLVDLYVKTVQETMKASEEAGLKAWNDMRTKWGDEVKADKELGGENLPKVQATIAKALDQFGDPGVREQLALTGADNNPAVVRTLYRMGQALTEGAHVPGSPGGEGPKTLADQMYPGGPKTSLRGE